MRRTICRGCGATVESDKVKGSNLHLVTLTVHAHDTREWVQRTRNGDTSYAEDLCDDCIGRILHNYFGVPAEGQLETPAFIQ